MAACAFAINDPITLGAKPPRFNELRVLPPVWNVEVNTGRIASIVGAVDTAAGKNVVGGSVAGLKNCWDV